MDRTELHKKATSLPGQPGCYIMRDAKREVVYVGKAKKLKNRVSGYFRAGAVHDPKTERMVMSVFDFDIIVTDSEFEALVLECSLIKQHMPRYNILLKDDKGYSYIKISNERYPRITVELQRIEDGSTYIGPYMSAFGIRQMVETANIIFGLPTCAKRFPNDFGKGRPCLNAHIGRCMGFCAGGISDADYQTALTNAVMMITKGSKEVLQKLTAEMRAASAALEFERAARLRDKINTISKSESGQKVVKIGSDLEMDVFAFAGNEKDICAVVLKFREGRLCDKDEQVFYDATSLEDVRSEFVSHYYINSRNIPKKVLIDSNFEDRELVERMLTQLAKKTVCVAIPQRGENHAIVVMAYNNAADRLKREAGRKNKEEAAVGELANLLGLDTAPKNIEAYDISNYGSEAVAGMVVFVNGLPKKSDYKRFIIRSVDGVDDYASMTEAILRRVRRFEDQSAGFAQKPDLIFLDGGKGHVSSIFRALEGTAFADVPLFGMVKDDKHRTRGVVSVSGELSVALHKSAFALVSKIQDETHRFTVAYQRSRHSKMAFRSALLSVNGIGEARAKLLLDYFKTVATLEAASADEIAAVPGMSRASAEAVYAFYHT